MATTSKQMLLEIRNILGINMSAVSTLLNISRSDLYKHYVHQDKEPTVQMVTLYSMSKHIETYNIINIESFIFRRLFDQNSKSLFDLLMSYNYNIDVELETISQMSVTEDARRKLSAVDGMTVKRIKSFQDALSDFSTPVYIDDESQ